MRWCNEMPSLTGKQRPGPADTAGVFSLRAACPARCEAIFLAARRLTARSAAPAAGCSCAAAHYILFTPAETRPATAKGNSRSGNSRFCLFHRRKKKKLRERAKNKQTNQQKHQNTPSKPAKSRKFYPMATHCSGNRANSIYNRIFRAFAHPEVAPRSAQSWCLVLGAWGVRRPRHEI